MNIVSCSIFFYILFSTKYFSVFNFYTSVILGVKKIHEATIFLNLPTYLNIRDWKVWKLKFKGSLPWIFENTIFKGPVQKDQVHQKVKQMENIAISYIIWNYSIPHLWSNVFIIISSSLSTHGHKYCISIVGHMSAKSAKFFI